MFILAFDTAVEGCSVVVLDTETGRHWADRLVTDRRQAEVLVPMIKAVMGQAGIGFSSLGRIAVTIGPGSFTGVRIGLATARALALASGTPLVGLSTLAVMAQSVVSAELPILAVLDTKREDFYGEVFSADGQVSQEAVRIWTAEEVSAAETGGALRVLKVGADALEIARCAARMTGAVNGGSPEPIYVRDAEVSVSKRVAPVAV